MNRIGIVLSGIALACCVAAVSAVAGGGSINCTGGPCNGTPGNDSINGSKLADQIDAKAGDDDVEGNGDNDRMLGGEGRDFLTGDLGNDTGNGGPGPDSIVEFPLFTEDGGADTYNGGKGSDDLEGGVGRDLLKGGKGNDRFSEKQTRSSSQRGFFGTTSCYRGFCSSLYGDQQGDVVKGGKGKDYIEGEEGRDRMLGGKGDDVIDSANDDTEGVKDVVECGDGHDVVFANGRDKVADDCEKVKPPQPAKGPMREAA
jgi:Ca2+-binding RTX toxin-like protein